MGVGVEGNFDRVTLREIAENDLSPRLERVPGVASVSVEGGLRRQIHVELSKEKITALELPVDRIVQLLRSENQNMPLGEIDEGDRTYLLRSQGQFENLDQIRNLVVMTRDRRAGLPARTSPRSRTRPRTSARSPGSTASRACGCGSRSSRARTPCDRRRGPGRDRAHQQRDPRLAAHGARRQLGLHQAVDRSVQEAAMLGAVLVIADHLRVPAQPPLDADHLHVDSDLDHRHVRAALLRRLHAEHDDVRRPGARRRHDRRRLDRRAREHLPAHGDGQGSRMQAAIDGSEEVWSAILASTLTHIAVFVPLLFLTGVSSILFKQLSFVVMFSLSMSLFVAVTHRAGALLAAAEAAGAASNSAGAQRPALHAQRTRARRDGRRLPPDAPLGAGAPADRHRRGHGASSSLAVLILPTIGVELMPQADEGEVSVTAELPVGTRIERGARRRAAARSRCSTNTCRRRKCSSRSAGGGGFMGGGGNRVNATLRLVTKHERTAHQRRDRARSQPAARRRDPRRHHQHPRIRRQLSR